ncbi:hypothetical protein IFM89_033021 [Coptis chinensis]|uniref:Uncharacterized protein n=1 Tax=Coptis chinensis TaxID=261450 RepID=A0A835IFP4_9MAGN|nr:hypothetical protein IFM89_033021 [Coptis chinensis]
MQIALFVSSSDAIQPGWLLTFFKSVSRGNIKKMRANLAKYSKHFLYSSPAQPLGPEDLAWRMCAAYAYTGHVHVSIYHVDVRDVPLFSLLCPCISKDWHRARNQVHEWIDVSLNDILVPVEAFTSTACSETSSNMTKI